MTVEPSNEKNKTKAKAIPINQVDVIAANLKFRHTGVTSTVVALLPVQACKIKIAALGPGLPANMPKTTWRSLFRHGWTRPSKKAFRIWHARRNNEMLMGFILRSVLRMPLRLLFTSDAQRHHTAWTRFLIRQMDAVIACAPESAAYLKVPHTINFHGVDTDIYHPVENRAKAWANTGLPGKYGIGVFGRVRSQKGTDRFVTAMCELLPKYPDFTAVVIGKVTPDQLEFSSKLKAQAEAAGLKDRIIFLGELAPEEVPEWFRRMTIVVGPQRWEGWGLVPVEAMASGAAVVVTRVGAAAHLIVEGETGHLVEIEDMEGMTKWIKKLMSDPAATELMGKKGRIHVVENLSIHREAEGIGKVYEKLWRESR